MQNIVIVGASGHGKVVADIARLQAVYQVVGFLDSKKPRGTEVLGIPVLGTEEDLPATVRDLAVDGAFVAIGDNFQRRQVVGRLRQLVPDIGFATVVHPSAQVAGDVSIGAGTAIMAEAVVNPGSRVGEFCLVNTRASLDHDCVMGDYSSLAPGVVTGGNVDVGAMSAVAIGATIVHRVSIGAHTVIGAAALVTRDVPAGVVAYGIPARVVRRREPSDCYL